MAGQFVLRCVWQLELVLQRKVNRRKDSEVCNTGKTDNYSPDRLNNKVAHLHTRSDFIRLNSLAQECLLKLRQFKLKGWLEMGVWTQCAVIIREMNPVPQWCCEFQQETKQRPDFWVGSIFSLKDSEVCFFSLPLKLNELAVMRVNRPTEILPKPPLSRRKLQSYG